MDSDRRGGGESDDVDADPVPDVRDGPAIERRVHALRRFTWWSVLYIVVFISALPAFDLAVGQHDGRTRVLAGVALAAFTVVHARLLLTGMLGLGRGKVGRLELVLGVLPALALWATLGVTSSAPWFWAFPAGAMAGAAAVVAPAAHRVRVVVGSSVAVALVGVLGHLVAGEGEIQVLVGAAVAGLLVPGAVAALDFSQLWLWDVALDLDRTRRATADLAVARERLRFAAELHDIQGHNLQAIALTAELAGRLVGVDDDAARRHALECRRLAVQALDDTRSLVQGYRTTSFSSELQNAVELLAAAGVEATVVGDPRVLPGGVQPLMGVLVREATTNLLRHSDARTCTVTVSRDPEGVRVAVHDDGSRGAPTDGGGSDGSGIASLRERFAAVGGRVEAGYAPGGGFEVSAWAPLQAGPVR